MPNYYDDPVAEYRHLLEHVALWDVAVERQTEITGRDAFPFTSLLTPRDLGKCCVGQGKYVLIHRGRAASSTTPSCCAWAKTTSGWPALTATCCFTPRSSLYTQEWTVQIREPDVSPMQIQGPKSREVVAALFGDRVLVLGYYRFFETELDGIPVLVTRTGWAGEAGYEIYLRDGSLGVELWERILEAGRPYSLRPAGPSDIRRI